MKRILSLVLIAISYFTVSAQTRPSEVQVAYPRIFMDGLVQEAQIEKFFADGKYGQNQKSNKHWIAYSDRANNKIYTTIGGATCGTLALNEKVRIAKIEKGGWALVYKEKEEGIKYPLISNRADVLGYVKMSNLLLWHSCPTNEYNIYHKALLCVNLDNKLNSDLGRLYYNPKEKNMDLSEQLSNDMNFYFVMKREGNMVLLAKQHSMDGFVDSNILVGWVAEGSYVPWDQRSCLEPTWQRSDVEAFTTKGTRYKIYESQNLAKEGIVVDEGFSTKVMNPKLSRYKYRMPAHVLRFPILSTLPNERGDTLYKCSTFGTAGGGRNVISNLASQIDVNSIKEDELRQMSNIDIAIVIDGTKSMGPYFQAVKQGIKDAERFFESGKFKIRIGLVVYRDYVDGEQYSVESYPFVASESRKLAELLDKGGSGYGFKSHPKDRTYEEALYLGLDTALESLAWNPKHSNLMFVIGDCGNHRDDNKFDADDIKQKLVEKNVNFMGFQVNFGQAEAFASFQNQIMSLMNQSLTAKYKALDTSTTVKWESTPDGYELVNSHQSKLLTGKFYRPQGKGHTMEASQLTELMQDAISYFKESITQQSELLAQFGFASSTTPIDGVEINENFIRQRLGDQGYEQVKNGANLLAFQGYTKKKLDGRNVYKPVLFISSEELDVLMRQLEGVNDAAANQDDREPYINAMKALILSLSPGMTEEQIQQKKVGEVMKMVMGLHEAPDALKQYTLADIANHRTVSPNEYRSLVKKFRDRYEYLNDLRNKPYDYTYTTNTNTYYWLPIEYLP